MQDSPYEQLGGSLIVIVFWNSFVSEVCACSALLRFSLHPERHREGTRWERNAPVTKAGDRKLFSDYKTDNSLNITRQTGLISSYFPLLFWNWPHYRVKSGLARSGLECWRNKKPVSSKQLGLTYLKFQWLLKTPSVSCSYIFLGWSFLYLKDFVVR